MGGGKAFGTIIEALPSIRFRVELADGRVLMAYLAGRLNRAMVRILIGDRVEVFVPDIGNICRITRRL